MTQYKSLFTPNTNAQDQAGWCLRFTQKVTGAPAGHPHATASGNAAISKIYSRDMPNVPVPVYFSWVNRIAGDPNRGVDQGHVVTWIPGSGFLSSPGSGVGQKWFNSIAAVEKYFGCTFRFWTLDMNGKKLAEAIADPAPAVTPPQATGDTAGFAVGDNVEVVNPVDTKGTHLATSGSYSIIQISNGSIVIGRDNAVIARILASNLRKVEAAPVPQPQPVAPAFAVGDAVVPTNVTQQAGNVWSYTDYNGNKVSEWRRKFYRINEINGDRVVLTAEDSGIVWAAVNIANIRKA